MKEQEHRLQTECIRWFRLQYPKRIIFAIPNGGQRNAVVAAKMKAEGVLAGVPDLFIPHPFGQWHGLFVEMKNGKSGRVSDRQSEVMEALTSEGYLCRVCRSFDDFYTVVSGYMNQ